MSAPKIVLHQWEISPFCTKVRRILAHKSLSFETIDYNGLRSKDALGLSKLGKLPVLDYDGTRVQDSVNIAAFLEKKHPEPSLYPQRPADRHYARILEDWAGESLYWFELYFRFADDEALEKALDHLCKGRPNFERSLMRPALRNLYKYALHTQGLGRMSKDEIKARFLDHLDALEGLLREGDWLVGAQKSIADISVCAQLHEVARTSSMAQALKARPQLSDWMERF